ncbi:UDP-N-acetylglucosamine 2-epimerase (non-hydrolyzing) [Flavobacteriaceae bacterium Ap0902]|nr:UDP-N-acetylglucosamine 2-epimerase (non-hydrolyzing) [Flavobacteriaceae bacterium Ap0902]
MKLTIVAGARPNFVKIAPLIKEIQQSKNYSLHIQYRLVHTGQHYDDRMSAQFFKDLEIPHPDVNLNAGSGSQAKITAQIMMGFEKELLKYPPDLVIVVGDVTSTLACTIAAKKLNIKVAHIEAGIRSYDLSMPEEINRMVTDSISDYFFTTTPEASELLKHIGKKENQIFFVGNIMIDTLLSSIDKLKKPGLFDLNNLKPQSYFILTLHRPSNVDEAQDLMRLVKHICQEASPYPIVFPIHPRTKKKFNLDENNIKNLIISEPLGYLEFNYLVKNALGVLTDSGGITEETSILNIPCITLRENTERPETITLGTNELAGHNYNLIQEYISKIKGNQWKNAQSIPLWDGKTANRILANLLNIMKP